VSEYTKIYSLKKRTFEKPLAIMVEDFEYLRRHTHISELQLNYLKKYPSPFTVLLGTKRDFILDTIPNKSLYRKTAFRVANLEQQRTLLRKIGPVFLTSLNISNTQEIYLLKDIPFEKSEHLEIIATQDLERVPPSDVFEFVKDSAQILYLRKNY
jgi:tRNA A37 threonylcarbamoyladenosine synthetase subunit TsaC/SUA5/YrdC